MGREKIGTDEDQNTSTRQKLGRRVVGKARDSISDAKETVIETKENAETAIKGAARNHLKATVQEINKNA